MPGTLFLGEKYMRILGLTSQTAYPKQHTSGFRSSVKPCLTKLKKGKNVLFEQGSGRVAIVPVDIVEDIIGTKVELFSRAA